jgi:hypothetical protein
MPNSFNGVIVELDKVELKSKRYTSQDGRTFFTPEGKKREDAENAKTIAAGQMSEELHIYYHDHESGWGKQRAFNMNGRWIFFYWDGDQNKPLVWVKRQSLDEGGTYAWNGVKLWKFYSEAGMRAEIKSTEERQRRRAEALRRWLDGGHQSAILAEDALTLGVTPSATETEVIAAFRRLVKVHHPDTGGTAEGFRRISQARDRALATLTARKRAA